MNIVILETEDDVNNYIEKINENKIIATDIQAHQLLNKKNISHYLIDDYFLKEDEKFIDDKALEFAKNWYNQECVKKNLNFNNMNIGKLLESKLLEFYADVLRRIVGIKRIIEKEKPQQILCGFLFPYCEIFSSNDEIEIMKLEERKYGKKKQQSIDLSFNIGGKNYSIKISSNNYTKLRNISEKFVTSIFKVKADLTKDKESILLLDCNPVLFPTLLKELSQNFANVLLMNYRRPAIWNKESLKIIRESGCKIIHLSDLSSNELKSQIKNQQKKYLEKILINFEDNEIQNYFQVFGIPFWKIIKKDMIQIVTENGNDMIKRYYLVEKLFEKSSINCILEWSLYGFEEQIVNNIALQKKIQIVFLQHAKIERSSKYEKYMTIHPFIPDFNAIEATWGEMDQKFLLEMGVKKNELVLTGSPKHDPFFMKKKEVSNEGTIIIAASGFSHSYTFAGHEIRSYKKLEESIRKTIQIVKSIPNVQPIIKLHPGEQILDIKELVQKIDPTIPIYKETNTLELLKKCDALISTDFSTILLDAMIFNKPTMFLATHDQTHNEEPMIKDGATCFIPNLDVLETAIK